MSTAETRTATDEEMCARCGTGIEVGTTVADVNTTTDMQWATAEWATVHVGCVDA